MRSVRERRARLRLMAELCERETAKEPRLATLENSRVGILAQNFMHL